ncbi:GcrA family cell cycle regulator [Bradyrhizobium cenepequi]|uniref:GcrA family cell cycle regulator n=1 Tax=Bradyrhizobium cenepequi TaxID=2821403 RepID=UPI001CE2F7E0|nr:GcrA family cell cycle regulator [Bradyrhizobium cenepequi]MCA6108153.1 hypothetical protein [Bradyrhizobium cenepequi]
MHGPSEWDDKAVGLLESYAPLFTASEIASRLAAHGYDFTRSAVIGKMRRLHVATRGGDVKKRKAPLPSPSAVAAFEPRLVPFLALEDGECKFECSPHDTPTNEFVFCGLPHLDDDGMPYCAYHRSIARRSAA